MSKSQLLPLILPSPSLSVQLALQEERPTSTRHSSYTSDAAMPTSLVNRSSILKNSQGPSQEYFPSTQMAAAVAEGPSQSGIGSKMAASELLNGESNGRRSVRRASGQRAESESTAFARRGNKQASKQALSSHFEIDADDLTPTNTRTSSDARHPSVSSKTPFSTVRRLFRTRSKSQSAPSKSSSRKGVGESIDEADESSPVPRQAVSIDQDTKGSSYGGIPAVLPPTSPTTSSSRQSPVQRQSRESTHRAGSFLLSLGRARTPPRTKTDWEGVEGSDMQRTFSESKKKSHFLDQQGSRPSTGKAPNEEESSEDKMGSLNRRSIESTGKKREKRISGLPPTSSDSNSSMFNKPNRQRTDFSLTLQSLSTMSPGSPYGNRRSSLVGSPSATPQRSPMELPASQSNRSTRIDETPTPTHMTSSIVQRRNAVDSSESTDSGDERRRTQTAHLGASPVKASVPRIWQASREAKVSPIDEDPVQETPFSKQRYGSSTTSGSALSFQTAQSFRDEMTPDLPNTSDIRGAPVASDLRQRGRHSQSNSLSSRAGGPFDTVKSIPRSATSPLSDLIVNLERISSSNSPSTPTGHRNVFLPTSATKPNGTQERTSVKFPSTDTDNQYSLGKRYQEDDSIIEDSVSSSFDDDSRPQSVKRNTFGNDFAFTGNSRDSTTTPTASQAQSPYLEGSAYNGRNVSMQEIESSLAAVEAALQDHRRAGSFDPNPLRQHITPRPLGNMSTGSLSLATGAASTNESLVDTTTIGDEEERLARVTLPPEQQYAIADAVRQVRRAISSSNLPQIPNEDDSDISRSPVVESAFTTSSAPSSAALPSQDNFTEEAGTTDTVSSSLLGLHPDAQHPYRRANVLSQESTPLRAARVRQESMQDVEQAYARMVELVSSAAGIEVTPSPMPSARFFTRRTTQSQPTAPVIDQPRFMDVPESPSQRQSYVRERTQSAAAPLPAFPSSLPGGWTSIPPPPPPLPPISASSSRSARQQLLRESDALARFLGRPLPDLSEETLDHQSNAQTSVGLRGRRSNVSLNSRGSRRAASESPPRSKPSDIDVKPLFPRESQKDAHHNTADNAIRVVTEQRTSSSVAGSGGGVNTSNTSPSVTVKTQGTPHLPDVQETVSAPHRKDMYDDTAHHQRHGSMSQPMYDWQARSRFSSPSSAQMQQIRQSKRMSGNSMDSGSAAARAMSFANAANYPSDGSQRRSLRASDRFSGSGGDPRISPDQMASIFGSTPGSGMANGDGMIGSNRRSGSIRDWTRMEDVTASMAHPSSNISASGPGTYYGGSSASRSHVMRPGEGSDVSDLARIALMNTNNRIASPSTSSVVAMQRRHALERDSLLDMLDRTRTEAMDMRSRNDQLQADLHFEVTRVLELERAMERHTEREEELAARVQTLEEELKAEQADRVRIGELLERVQRAVDDAANARSAPHTQTDDSQESQRGVYDDETMEVVQGIDTKEASEDLGDVFRRHEISSPTSSSISIRQEDLLPVKRRVFDPIHADDVVETEEELADQPSVLQSYNAVQANPLDADHLSISSAPKTNDDLGPEEGRRSPSLHSRASALGLDVNEQEMSWALDEESPPDSHESSPPDFARLSTPNRSTVHDDQDILNDYYNSDVDSTRAATRGHGDSSFGSSAFGAANVNGDGLRHQNSTLSKRSTPAKRSPFAASRLPVLAKSAARMSASTSGTSTVIPSASIVSSTGHGLQYRDQPGDQSSRDAAEGAGASTDDGLAPLSPRGQRQVSGSSRTTGADTSVYSARTVSPIGSFIPTFPTMSSGVRRQASGRRQVSRTSSHGGHVGSTASGDAESYDGLPQSSSPFRSPVQARSAGLHASHMSVGGAKFTPVKSAIEANSAMRSAGGYYDTRRPAGYDPVDVSALSALSAEDSL